MTTKVSVVIPVWNPGKFIDRCVDSLLAQTMPASEFEVLFMDDGSTDGTEDRLDELAKEHANFVVEHLENSGWPGKPRNLGIDRAAGEYVLFMDNDDALGAEALERMYAIGARNNSDIVIGKEISNWRPVAHHVFRYARECCTIHDTNLFDSLTPHKMFRRRFLIDNQLRYPEGKRRLEDQLIMARAYFPAKCVSIVNDYTCYYYLRREDGSNAGSAQVVPEEYYGNLREVLDVVEANTEPGDFRDSILARFYRGEMLSRLGGRALPRYRPRYRTDLFAEVRRLALEPRFGPGVHARLGVLNRLRSYFVREDRLQDLITYTERTNVIHGRCRLEDMRWEDGALVLTIRAGFTYADKPLRLVRQDGRLFVPHEIALDAPDAERECTDEVETTAVDATIKNRATSEEFFLPIEFHRNEKVAGTLEGGEGVEFEWVGEVRIDPATALGGRALPRGTWDVSARVAGFGFARVVRLGRDRNVRAERGTRAALVRGSGPATLAIPYWTTPHGNLSLDIDEESQSLTTAVTRGARARTTPRAGTGSQLRLTLPIAVASDQELTGSVRLIERSSNKALALAADIGRGASELTLTALLPSREGGLPAGSWDIAVELPAVGWTQAVRIRRLVDVPRVGPTRARLDPTLRRARRWRLLARELGHEMRRLAHEARQLNG